MEIYYPTENLTTRTGKAYGTAIYDFLSTNELITEFFDVTVEATTSTSDHVSDTIWLTAKSENISGLKIKIYTSNSGSSRRVCVCFLYNGQYYVNTNINGSPSTTVFETYVDVNNFQDNLPIYLSYTATHGIYVAFGQLYNSMVIVPILDFLDKVRNDYAAIQSMYYVGGSKYIYYAYTNGTSPQIKKIDEYFYDDNVGYSNNRMLIPLSRNGNTFADIYLIDGGMTLPSQGVYKINNTTYAIIQGNIAVALAEED